MTWEEFKESIDKQVEEKGWKESEVVLEYIDWHNRDKPELVGKEEDAAIS